MVKVEEAKDRKWGIYKFCGQLNALLNS